MPVAITRNQRYDRMTKAIMKQVCTTDSSCIDVGCHTGEILDVMIQVASQGKHLAFEPLPDFYNNLKQKYAASSCVIYPFALSHQKGKSTFHYVKSNPAYSGLRKRAYAKPNEEIVLIETETAQLDDLLPADQSVQFIKIDVFVFSNYSTHN